MPGWLKALVIVLAIIVVLAAGVIAAGVYWFYRNKEALIARGKAVATEGRDFGRGTDNQGCVDQSIMRYKRDPGFRAAISNSIFMRTCLDSSRVTLGFCDDVPRQSEFIKTSEWRLAQCRRVGLSSDHNCQNLFTPVQQFCGGQRE
jgi:hypothetical protein